MYAIVLALILALASSACTPLPSISFSESLESKSQVQLTGWARVHGELMLYPTRASFESHDRYPNCISGRFSVEGPEDLDEYDGKRVTVRGTLYDYDSLPNDDAPLLQRKLINGLTIPNFCFGKRVLLLSSIKITRIH